MTKKHQVRLDADVAEALGRDAERKGTSLNVTANTWLRRALGLQPGAPSAAPAPAPPSTQPARLVPAQSTASAGCKHPANRRVGPYCMAEGCGVRLPLPKGIQVQRRQ